MQPVRIVSNRAEAQGTLVDLLNPQPLSHLSLDHAKSYALALPHNRILELSTMQRRYRIRCNPRFVIRGSRMLVVLLPPVAVLAGALGCWRFGADPGWTNRFFISNGLLSHWQAWFAVAIVVHTSARSLNGWLERYVGANK
jgi:hypothetical protein